jgi:hypothetical protein
MGRTVGRQKWVQMLAKYEEDYQWRRRRYLFKWKTVSYPTQFERRTTIRESSKILVSIESHLIHTIHNNNSKHKILVVVVQRFPCFRTASAYSQGAHESNIPNNKPAPNIVLAVKDSPDILFPPLEPTVVADGEAEDDVEAFTVDEAVELADGTTVEIADPEVCAKVEEETETP